MNPSLYTLERAAEIFGMRTLELLGCAADGRIKLVFIASDAAPVQVSGLCQTYDIDGNLVDETALKPESRTLTRCRSQIVVPLTAIDRLESVGQAEISVGLVYSPPLSLVDRAHLKSILGPIPYPEKCVTFEPPKAITLADLRVPVDEIERIQAGQNAGGADKPESQNESLSEQEKREIVLSKFLIDRFNGVAAITTMTRREVWKELEKHAPQLFGFKSDATVDAFFKKQNICTFQVGRKASSKK